MLTPKEIKDIGHIIEKLASDSGEIVKEDIAELKKDITEYKEDLKEVEKITMTAEKPVKLSEAKSAKILSKRVEKLINEMDELIIKLEKEESAKAAADPSAVPTKSKYVCS